MQSIRLEATGQKPTSYKCYVGFYDFTRIQGRFYGWLVKLTGLSKVTHVGPIIEVPGVGDITITICSSLNGKSSAKIHTAAVLERSGAVLVDKVFVGMHQLDLKTVFNDAHKYADVTAWDVIFYNFIGRFLGLTRPRACASYVCNLFGLPEAWHPATLWRQYDNDSTGGTSQSR
jgi:hypothetical protein